MSKPRRIRHALTAVFLSSVFCVCATNGALASTEDSHGSGEAAQTSHSQNPIPTTQEATPLGNESLDQPMSGTPAPADTVDETDQQASGITEFSSPAPMAAATRSAVDSESVTRSGEAIAIASFADLKPYLEVREYRNNAGQAHPRLLLKPGHYQLTRDFTVDLSDPFLSDKTDAIQYGLLSVVDGDFSFDGAGKTITFTDQAVPLFGLLHGGSIQLTNLKVHYLGDVAGFGLAQEIVAGSRQSEAGFVEAAGIVTDVVISVDGNVQPLQAIERVTMSNHFIGRFDGVISTGVAWYLHSVNLDNVSVSVAGNIGSDTVASGAGSAAAFGLTFHYSNAGYSPNGDEASQKTWQEIHGNRNPQPLRGNGHMADISISVGGNIQAYTNDAGYTAGMGQDLGEAWIERARVAISGDIKTMMQGEAPITRSLREPHAHGISEEVMNFTDSTLTVGNIVFDSNPAITEQLQQGGVAFALIAAIAEDNSKGNYLNISNNNVTVSGAMKVSSSLHVILTGSFHNTWNSDGTNGVNWLHYNENNTYTIGAIDARGTGNAQVAFDGLGAKWRTGTKPLGNTSDLPEASLKNNSLVVGDVNINNPQGDTYVQPMMGNLSNAKNNTATYGNLTIEAEFLDFTGMGDLRNTKPEVNVHPVLTENNHLVTGDVRATASRIGQFALAVGLQDPDQPMKDSSATVKSVSLQVDGADQAASNVTGLVSYAQSDMQNCSLYVGDVNVTSASTGDMYFGMGIGYGRQAAHSGNTVLIDRNISISHAGRIWGGGYSGYLNQMTLTNTHLQIGGESQVSASGGEYGGFAGRLKLTDVTRSTALLLNDYAPFVYAAEGGVFDGIAHYINKPVLRYYSGLLATHKADTPPVIKNSTLLVERANADSVLYRPGNVAAESTNNFLTVVDDSTEGLNRKAYRVDETVISEGNSEHSVVTRTGTPIGQVNIAPRAFQDKYWNPEIGVYTTGEDEQSFAYVDKTEIGDAVLAAFSVPDGIVTGDASRAALSDYYNRFAGVFVADGPVYDLLGIKAFAAPPAPDPEPEPQPEPSPEPGPDPNPGDKPVPQPNEPQPQLKVSKRVTPSKLSATGTGTAGVIGGALGAVALGALLVLRSRRS